VNLSMMTMHVALEHPFDGPDQIKAPTTNGHAMGIVWSAWVGKWV
jgi:hypothetical protein